MQLDAVFYVFYYFECDSKQKQITEGLPNKLYLKSFKGLILFISVWNIVETASYSLSFTLPRYFSATFQLCHGLQILEERKWLPLLLMKVSKLYLYEYSVPKSS